MYHSITFGETGATKNTWTNWKLMPESPPVVSSPTPKTDYVDIPGRAKGPIDMSKLPFNRQTYERVTGSWTFAMLDDYWNTPDPRAVYNEIRGWLQGRRTRMTLDDESNYIYYGLFTADAPSLGMGPFVIKINYDIEPVRYNLDGTADLTWLTDVSSWIDSGGGPILPPDVPAYIVPITDEEINNLFD